MISDNSKKIYNLEEINYDILNMRGFKTPTFLHLNNIIHTYI
jgi:hypothetical protein